MFRLWHLRWRRFREQRSFDKEEKKLRKENAPNYAFAELAHNEHITMDDIEDGIDYVRSRRLLDNARSLDVETPLVSDAGMWNENEEEEEGVRWLTSNGRAHLRKAVDEEKARRFDVKTRWVTKIILPLAAVLVGVVGAVTGLVAVLRK